METDDKVKCGFKDCETLGTPQRGHKDFYCDPCLEELARLCEKGYAAKRGWIEIRRGFGELDLSTLNPGEFATASGLHDEGFVVWTRRI